MSLSGNKILACKILFPILLWLTCPLFSWGQDSPYVHHSEVGILIGNDSWGKRVNFSFQTFNGVRFHPHHELGFVTGIDQYGTLSLVPIALGWRGILNPESKIVLFTGFDLGYGSTLLEKREISEWNEHRWYEGGLMYQPNVGLKLKTKKNRYWTMAFGFKKQVNNHFAGMPIVGIGPNNPDYRNTEDWNYIAKHKITFNNLVFKIGFQF